MRLYYTERFAENLRAAPTAVQRAFAKQARLLVGDLRHPSLRAKKYDKAGMSGRRGSIRIGASISRFVVTRTFCATSSPIRNDVYHIVLTTTPESFVLYMRISSVEA